MIYVVGSLNMDISATVGSVPRAGETVIANSTVINPGGKGANQAAAVGKLGGSCAMIGKVGADGYGAQMKAALSGYGVNTEHVTVADCPSGTAMIWVHKGNNRIVVNAGANARLTPEDVAQGLRDAKAGDVLIIQLEVPHETVSYALSAAKRKGMVTILNPAPAMPLTQADYENSEIIAPNETETEILTGISPDCEVNLALAVKKLREMGATNIVITLGSRGSAVAVGNEITLVPAVKVKAADTTAAGDTFVGAMSVMLGRGENIAEAARFASYASALKVTRVGAAAAIPTIAEIEEFRGRRTE